MNGCQLVKLFLPKFCALVLHSIIILVPFHNKGNDMKICSTISELYPTVTTHVHTVAIT